MPTSEWFLAFSRHISRADNDQARSEVLFSQGSARGPGSAQTAAHIARAATRTALRHLPWTGKDLHRNKTKPSIQAQERKFTTYTNWREHEAGIDPWQKHWAGTWEICGAYGQQHVALSQCRLSLYQWTWVEHGSSGTGLAFCMPPSTERGKAAPAASEIVRLLFWSSRFSLDVY